jgi:hypothetical protein
MATAVRGAERVVNVGDIGPQHRRIIIFQLFEHLAAGDTLQLSSITIQSRCGTNLRQDTARFVCGPIWRKAPMSGAFDCKKLPDRMWRMFERQHCECAARLAYRATGTCRGPSFQPSRTENLEVIFAAINQSIAQIWHGHP